MDAPARAAVARKLGIHGLLSQDGELVKREFCHCLTLELVKKLNDRAGALLVHQFLLLALLLSLGGADAGPPAIYGRGERWVMMVQGAGRGGVGGHLALEY